MLLTNEQIKELLQMVREGKALYFQGNVPSQKNSKDIKRMFLKVSKCCNSTIKWFSGKSYKKCSSCGQTIEGQCTSCGKSVQKRPFITSSKLVEIYKKDKEAIYLQNKVKFKKLTTGLEPPYYIGYFIIRDSKRKFDYSNILECPQDLFSKYNYWEDDNMENNHPVVLGYTVSKKNAGLIVVVLKEKPYIKLD